MTLEEAGSKGEEAAMTDALMPEGRGGALAKDVLHREMNLPIPHAWLKLDYREGLTS
jgi:hypothetical protein